MSKNNKNTAIHTIIFHIYIGLVFFFVFLLINSCYSSRQNNLVTKYILTNASIKKENGSYKTVGYTKSIMKAEDHKKIIAYTKKEPEYLIDTKNNNMLVKIYQKK